MQKMLKMEADINSSVEYPVHKDIESLESAWLGRRPYMEMWMHMRKRADSLASGHDLECIWSCEHDPVYTTGRRGRDNRKITDLPAPWVQTDRGGETTFHGPGQVMLYPVMNLRARNLGAREYVKLLELSCISLLGQLGVFGYSRCGLPGVWSNTGKLAAIGIRIRNGIAYHGMALNVNIKPHWFEYIDPCGLGLSIDSLDRYGDFQKKEADLARMWTAQLIHMLS